MVRSSVRIAWGNDEGAAVCDGPWSRSGSIVVIAGDAVIVIAGGGVIVIAGGEVLVVTGGDGDVVEGGNAVLGIAVACGVVLSSS